MDTIEIANRENRMPHVCGDINGTVKDLHAASSLPHQSCGIGAVTDVS
jgi:hypothetical protein